MTQLPVATHMLASGQVVNDTAACGHTYIGQAVNDMDVCGHT